MKTAIYIEDGLLQLVITPETEHEKACVQLFEGKSIDTKIHYGSFYDCHGGWVRHSGMTRDRSLILRVAKSEPLSGEPTP